MRYGNFILSLTVLSTGISECLGQVHSAVLLAWVADEKVKAQLDALEPYALSRQWSRKWLASLHLPGGLLDQSALLCAHSFF